jgi:hypothetical protein
MGFFLSNVERQNPLLSYIYIGGKMQEVENRRERGIGRMLSRKRADELVRQGRVEIRNEQYFYK